MFASLLAALAVASGHVAAWVGVGTRASGWLQVGLASFPDSSTPDLYYETRAGGYHYLGHATQQSYRLGISEASARRWRVSVAGRYVSGAIFITGAGHPIATAESWITTTTPNHFRYRLDALSGRVYQRFASAGCDVTRAPGGYIVSG